MPIRPTPPRTQRRAARGGGRPRGPHQWTMHSGHADPANSSQETKARRPLAAAEVVVDAIEDNPGYYSAKFFLRPHFQLEGLTVSLRLVTKLPSIKQAA